MDLNRSLALIAESLKVTFTLNNRPIPPDEMFKPNSVFPAILRRADQLCSFCLGHGLGIVFEENKSALLGVTARLDDEVPNSLRVMCSTEILYELMESSPEPSNVSLDNLMYD